MEEFIRQLIIRIGWSVFPATLLLFLSQNPIRMPTPSPAPTSTPTATLTPTLAPTNTITPTPSPSPKPTHTPTPTPSPTPMPPPAGGPATSGQLDEWFTKYSNQYSVDRQKLWNVAVCESKLKTNATNGDYGGLYQFTAHTWETTRRAMNLDPNPELRFNPEEAIRTAAFKISTVGLSPWPACGKKQVN